MLTNKNSKFLFYNFNNYLNRCGEPVEKVRHTVKDWSNFIEKLFQVSEKENFELENNRTEIDSVENKLLLDTISNLQICKHFTILCTMQLQKICKK